MKELEDLTDTEKTVLLAFCDANELSLSSRVPIEAIAKRVQDIVSGRYLTKAKKTLLSNWFIKKHPSRRKMTYQLTRKGLDAGRRLI